MESTAIDHSRQTEGTHMVYLIVGLDRRTFARWHRNVMAPDAKTAEQIARDRAAAEGVRLIVAATIGSYSSIVDDPIDTSVVRVA
jgi:hypothetical protein